MPIIAFGTTMPHRRLPKTFASFLERAPHPRVGLWRGLPRWQGGPRVGLPLKLVVLVALAILVAGGSAGTVAVTGARRALHDHILETSLATADVAAALVTTYLTEAEAS